MVNLSIKRYTGIKLNFKICQIIFSSYISLLLKAIVYIYLLIYNSVKIAKI